MIKFPKLEDYISGYNNPSNIICIRFVPIVARIRPKYFAVSTPFNYGCFIEFLNELLNQMQLPVKVEQISNENSDCYERINMWQLHWFIKNIKNTKVVDIAIKSIDDKQINLSVDLNDEQQLKNLMTTLKYNAR